MSINHTCIDCCKKVVGKDRDHCVRTMGLGQYKSYVCHSCLPASKFKDYMNDFIDIK